MTNHIFELDSGCHQPGWDEGPAKMIGRPSTFLCELDADHEGPHKWNLNGPDEIFWPVTGTHQMIGAQ